MFPITGRGNYGSRFDAEFLEYFPDNLCNPQEAVVDIFEIDPRLELYPWQAHEISPPYLHIIFHNIYTTPNAAVIPPAIADIRARLLFLYLS
jgi:hypothetical protein